MSEERWTEQTEQLAARAVFAGASLATRDDVRAVLAALADAGLLVAPGGEAREQVRCSTAERESYVRSDSRVWWERGECVLADGHEGDHQTSTGTLWKWIPGGGMACDSTSARAGGPWRREVKP